MEIVSKDVVPGDILLLEAGDMIAADGRILDNYSLQVNESSLTGESANVDKTNEAIVGEAALADRINMVYSGTLVTYGRATVLVTATGMQTEMGKIADLMNATQPRLSTAFNSLMMALSAAIFRVPIACTIVTMELSASRIAATASATANMSESSTGCR